MGLNLVEYRSSENVESSHDRVLKRNAAFTAMTRTKGWLSISGVGSVAEQLLAEIQQILAVPGSVKFIVPDKKQIERNIEMEQIERKRKKQQKVKKSMNRLIEDLLDTDGADIPEDQLELLQNLIEKKKRRQDGDENI